MEIKKIIENMTLEEKAGLCSGADNWNTKEVKRLGVPSIMVSDGPHGLRKQKNGEESLGVDNAVKAVCFPTASALACSFDPELIYQMGEALGEECQSEKVAVLLGPGINMKRSPLCGRNFEYFSEDPYLAGVLGSSFVKGVQSKNVGTSLKHFAANNQETRRLTISSNVDERTLREIYFPAFERVIKEAKPWTVMCSYNCINGTYSSENDWLLNHVLREEWGYDGLVVSDWGAVNNRVKGVEAGLDLEMPYSNGVTDAQLVEAVKAGELSEKVLDQACERVLKLVEKYETTKVENAQYEKELHHEMARKIESECAVLLKNDQILPLKPEENVLFLGGYAKTPRYQGGGSSHINSFKVSSACESSNNKFVLGFDVEQTEIDEKLIAEAVEAAKKADKVVIFAGLPESYESEGFDRRHMELPPCQNALIEAVAKVQNKIVVVLHNGSPVVLPWRNQVKGILEMYLGGQAVGQAAMDLLYGKVNPSGKLAETFPLRIQDNPSYLNFPGERLNVSYGEGLFIGYRYYDKKEMSVQYPFGYGLSYTEFEYESMKLLNGVDEITCKSSDETTVLSAKEMDPITVEVMVKNVGAFDGKETVQVYVHQKNCKFVRPEKELKGFKKIALKAGESKKVTITLDRRAFAYYNVEKEEWMVDSDQFEILVGSSSRDIKFTGTVQMKRTKKSEFKITDRTLIADVIEAIGDYDLFIAELKKHMNEDQLPKDMDLDMLRVFLYETPVHAIRSFISFQFTDEDLEAIVNNYTE